MDKSNTESLVSVVVPVYNVEQYLNRCIESLINQTYENIEILLIDDGSADDSPQICDEWTIKDSRIKVYHKENGGVSSARNIGLKKCHADYVLFVDPDDYVANNFVEVLLDSIVNNNCDMAIINFIEKYSDETIENVNHFKTEKKLLKKADFLDHIYDSNSYYGGPCNKIYLKKIIDDNNITFNEKVHYGEDLLFTVRYADKSQNFYYEYDENLYYYFRRDESVTNSKFNKKTASFVNIAEQLIDIFEKNKVDSSRIKKQYICFYFKALYYLENNKDFSKMEYKKIIKKYKKDVFKSKKIDIYAKLYVFAITYFPQLMKKIQKDKM